MEVFVSGLDIFAWVVLIVLIGTVIAIFLFLAMLPGRIARQRNHPQHEAVNVAGWLGAIALGVFWPLALVWAFYVSPGQELPMTDEGAVS
jgi:NADH:ubiquinone oxidoreductase subunit 6 (subunit J)